MNIEVLSFLLLSLVIAITPGPSVLFVVTYSLRFGPKAGIFSTLGVNAGSVIFVLMAAYGLASILELYPTALFVIQLAGGAYIIYLALMMWPRDQSNTINVDVTSSISNASLFKNGFITSLLNPKDILFYTAFIPTFVPVGTANEQYSAYFLALAFSYVFIGFLSKSAFALFAGKARQALTSDYVIYLNYFSAIVMFVLGVYIVLVAMQQLLN